MSALIRHPRFGKEFVVIVYNGEGIYAYSSNGFETRIQDADGNFCSGVPASSAYIPDCSVLHYKSLEIGDMLQSL